MAKVGKGLIAVAGLTSRFLPVSKGCPKGLLPVLEKPVIHYIVEEMIGAGIDQICIVHSPGDLRIKHYFTPNLELQTALKKAKKTHLIESLKAVQEKVRFKFISQPRKRLPYGNGTPVLVAKSFLGRDPFVYAFGDDFTFEKYSGQLLKQLISVFQKHKPAGVIAVQKVPPEEVSRYGSIEFARDSKIPNQALRVLEKLPADQAPSNYVRGGRFVYSSKVIDVLEKLPTEKKGGQVPELWLADADNVLAQTDVLIAEPIKGAVWTTTGDPLRWLQTNLLMALKNPEYRKGIKQFIKDKNLG